jgi:hypothetical protein
MLIICPTSCTGDTIFNEEIVLKTFLYATALSVYDIEQKPCQCSALGAKMWNSQNI